MGARAAVRVERAIFFGGMASFRGRKGLKGPPGNPDDV